MLDTCILIDFHLIESKKKHKQPIHKALKTSEIIRNYLLKGDIVNKITLWNLLEYRDVLEKIIEEKKLIENGYSLQEFSEGRKILPLTSKELEITNKAKENIKEISEYSHLQISDIFENLLEIYGKLGFTLLDAIHLIHAQHLKDCQYFVTRDNRLINQYKSVLKKGLKERVKLINRKELINLVEKGKKNFKPTSSKSNKNG